MVSHRTHIENNTESSILSNFRSPKLEPIKPSTAQFISQIFNTESAETIHLGLYEELINRGTDGILEKLKEYAKERRRFTEQFRERVKLRIATPNTPYASEKIVGVDAGRNGTNYRFAFVPIYGAVAVLVNKWKITEDPICMSGAPDIWPMEKDPERRESLLHMALEYHVAKKAVEQWHPRHLIFDGGLVLNPRLHVQLKDSKDYRKDFIFTVITSLSLLELCRNRGVSVVGFVKRTKMSHFHTCFNTPPIRDSILLNPILQVGEYIEPFLMKNTMTKTYSRLADELSLGSNLTEMYSSYIKTGQPPPYRIEVPYFCLDKIKEIASILLTTADPEGIPYPLHEADRYTKITRPTSNIHALVLYTKALDLVKKGQLDPADLDLLILQYGEPWSLHESEFWEELEQGK